MMTPLRTLILLAIAQLSFAVPASAQWYINQGFGNAGFGPMGGSAGPASSLGAGPIGWTQPRAVGDLNIGGAFGGGSVTANGTLNGAVASGYYANAAGGLGFGGYGDALLYGSAAAAGYGGYGGYGGGITVDPYSNYAAVQYNGMANLLRADGSYTLDESKAMEHTEKARTRYIDNEQKIYQARQAFKRMKAAEVTEQRDADRATRERREEFLAANRPRPLSQEHYDPDNGRIQWPAALMEAEFDETRKSIDDLFEQKTRGYDKSATASKLNLAVQDMREILRTQILIIPLQDYSEARQFLDRMAATVK
ncbi:hypothetical protein [Schlesneria sp. DSM 10557]|uniref:hypothetical protein n=1 Tax=Schlesneria sp. DSM 10557 TaxID=3044399 RepID=UPI00359FC4D4